MTTTTHIYESAASTISLTPYTGGVEVARHKDGKRKAGMRLPHKVIAALAPKEDGKCGRKLQSPPPAFTSDALPWRMESLDIADIKIMPETYQPRDAEFSEKRVTDILDNFNILKMLPVIVRSIDDEHHLLHGHHRCEVAKRLGWSVIPAIIYDSLTDDEALSIAHDANESDMQLTAFELGRKFRDKASEGVALEKISALAGSLGRKKVQGYIDASYCDSQWQSVVNTGNLALDYAIAMGKAVQRFDLDSDAQAAFLNKITSQDWTPAMFLNIITSKYLETIAAESQASLGAVLFTVEPVKQSEVARLLAIADEQKTVERRLKTETRRLSVTRNELRKLKSGNLVSVELNAKIKATQNKLNHLYKEGNALVHKISKAA